MRSGLCRGNSMARRRGSRTSGSICSTTRSGERTSCATRMTRPKRSATDAIQAVMVLLRQGHTDVVDADLSKYFPHDERMQSIARRIVDGDMLRLIKQWLKAPVETTDGDGRRRMEGGKASRHGTPQGGVISPLVANLYMNRFLKHWRRSGKGEAWQAHVINYADDFVILSRGHAA